MPTTGQTSTLLEKFCGAIQEKEGFYSPGSTVNGATYPTGSPAYRNNNPGNCRYNPSGYRDIYDPVKRSPSGFAVFKDYATGWLYLNNMVKHKIEQHPTWTISQFFADSGDGFAPLSVRPEGL